MDICHKPFYFLIVLECPFREWLPLCVWPWFKNNCRCLPCQAPIFKYSRRVDMLSSMNLHKSEQVRQEQDKWLTVIHQTVPAGLWCLCFRFLCSSELPGILPILDSSLLTSIRLILRALDIFWNNFGFFLILSVDFHRLQPLSLTNILNMLLQMLLDLLLSYVLINLLKLKI